jgi:sec-independent protein translocase protein TatA
MMRNNSQAGENDMFGLGTQELIIILVLVLIIFGAGKLPQVGGAIGKGLRNFKEGIKEGDDDAEKKLEEKKPEEKKGE